MNRLKTNNNLDLQKKVQTQENDENVAVKVIDRLKGVYRVNSDSDLSRYLGISTSTVSSWRVKGTIDYQRIFALCPELNRNFIVDGEEPVFKKELHYLYEELEKARIENEKQEKETNKYKELANSGIKTKNKLLKEYKKRVIKLESVNEVLKEIIREFIKQTTESRSLVDTAKKSLDAE